MDKINKMRGVRVTTQSGHSWATSINGSNKSILKYLMGQTVDIGAFPEEKMEKVVKVEFIRSGAMMKKITFKGRESGALGIEYQITDKVSGELGQEDARLALYSGETETGKAYECVSEVTY